jgi:hypothetical protein
MGLISSTSTRLPMVPVTHRLELPSTILVPNPNSPLMVMDECMSEWTPQTRGEHTTRVTLSVKVSGGSGRVGKWDGGDRNPTRLTVTDVGEGAWVSPSRRHPGGHSEVSNLSVGGGSGGGGNVGGFVMRAGVEMPSSMVVGFIARVRCSDMVRANASTGTTSCQTSAISGIVSMSPDQQSQSISLSRSATVISKLST